MAKILLTFQVALFSFFVQSVMLFGLVLKLPLDTNRLTINYFTMLFWFNLSRNHFCLKHNLCSNIFLEFTWCHFYSLKIFPQCSNRNSNFKTSTLLLLFNNWFGCSLSSFFGNSWIFGHVWFKSTALYNAETACMFA